MLGRHRIPLQIPGSMANDLTKAAVAVRDTLDLHNKNNRVKILYLELDEIYIIRTKGTT